MTSGLLQTDIKLTCGLVKYAFIYAFKSPLIIQHSYKYQRNETGD